MFFYLLWMCIRIFVEGFSLICGFWLSFTRILVGFGLIWFDFGWIWLGLGWIWFDLAWILHFRLLLL